MSKHIDPPNSQHPNGKVVCVSELLTAWDMAHDSLTSVADAARKCGHPEFAREAETIADSLESRVTALSKIAGADAVTENQPTCDKCGEENSVTEYDPDSGWFSWCKICQCWTFHGET